MYTPGVLSFEPLACTLWVHLHIGPDGTELILEEGGVHSLTFAIACDNGSNIMAGPFLVNTKGPRVCEAAQVSRIQRESQACMASVCTAEVGRVAGMDRGKHGLLVYRH